MGRGCVGRLVILGLGFAAFAVGAGSASLLLFAQTLPDLNSLEDYRPPVTSRVFDIHGNVVARFYSERRTVVPVERIPAHVKNAFIAAEDSNFYQHEGIDFMAVFASVLNEIKVKLVGGSRRGGSTITQQTAKTFLLSPEQTYSRKLKEMLLAKKIEDELTKDEILHLYLNQIYFGHGAYGVEEAAKTYYGTGVEELSLGQAAALASIPKSPNRINPFADPARVRSRRAYVLEQMVENNLVSTQDAAAATKEPVRMTVEPPEFLNSAPYYAEAIRRQLAERYGSEIVNQGGLKVYAALDAKLQVAATEALQKGLREVDKRQGWRGPLVRLDADERKDLLAALDEEKKRRFPTAEIPELSGKVQIDGRPIWDLANLSTANVKKYLSRTEDKSLGDEEDDEEPGISDRYSAMTRVRTIKLKKGRIVAGVVTKVDNTGKKARVDLGTIDAVIPFSSMKWARQFAPTKTTAAPKKPSDVLRAGDVVFVRIEDWVVGQKDKNDRPLAPWLEGALEQEPQVEGAFVAIDPHDHRVLALVGGYDFSRSKFNRATQAKRQPGSAFKPFIYGLGIESKKFTPVGFYDSAGSRLITDAPKVFFDRWTGKKWAPKNSGARFRGDISLRTCLTHSVNTCSITILEELGVEPVLKLTEQIGLASADSPFPRNLTLALGTGETQPLGLVNAYTIFPNGGSWAPPVLIEKVKDRDGNMMELAKTEALQIISPASAYVMSDLMKSVVENGTGQRAKALARPVAGKTGTTNLARSVWFMGFTPDIVAGAYVGFDNNDPLGPREYGGKAALPIWLDFMREAVAKSPVRDFQAPEGVVRRAIDAKTGLLVDVPPSSAVTQMMDSVASALPAAPAPVQKPAPQTSGEPTRPTENESPYNALEKAFQTVLGFVPGLAEAREKARAEKAAPAPANSPATAQPQAPSTNAADDLLAAVASGLASLQDSDLMSRPGELPLDPEKVVELPEGSIAEVFVAGTEPTQLMEDQAPPPLELLEGLGGLAP